MVLTSAPVAARATERGFQEVLNELLKNTFDGRTHSDLLGNQVYPVCDLFFNQTEIAAPDANTQIHTVFLAVHSTEVWWGGQPGAWATFLASPTGGVSYGVSVDDRVEETVHGRLIRSVAGTGIRWLPDAGGLHEQVLFHGVWFETREFPGADAIQWLRSPGEYQEQVRAAGTNNWSTVRTIYPTSPVWDGNTKRVTGSATVAFYVRTANFGGGNNARDFENRQVADQLKELFQSGATVRVLAAKGIKHAKVPRGPNPVQGAGFQCRLLTMTCDLDYLLPRT